MTAPDASSTATTVPSASEPDVDETWGRLLSDFEGVLAGVADDLARGRVPEPPTFIPPHGHLALPRSLEDRARTALAVGAALVDELTAAMATTRNELHSLKTERRGRPQAAFIDDRV